MTVENKFQVKLFDNSQGLIAMENAANAWLNAASSEVLVIDRQINMTNETSRDDVRVFAPYVILAIWYTKRTD